MTLTGEMANDVGTVLVGNEAVNCGIIDEVGTFQAASAKIRDLAELTPMDK